jgi:hypothetical protein
MSDRPRDHKRDDDLDIQLTPVDDEFASPAVAPQPQPAHPSTKVEPRRTVIVRSTIARDTANESVAPDEVRTPAPRSVFRLYF